MEELIPRLAQFDPLDLACKVAALQLIPENAGRLVRLHFLAELVARLIPQATTRKISRGQLRKICNQSSLSRDWAYMEDPPESFVTANISFVGGSYTVFPGIVHDGVETIELLGKAIFLHPDPFPDPAFQREARNLIGAVLALSNAIAVRARLPRWQEPMDNIRSVIVPPEQRLDYLAGASSFREEEVFDLLSSANLTPDILEPLTQNIGEATGPIDQENLSVFARPILAITDKRIVIAPGELLAALRHRLLVRAQELGLTVELAKRLRDAAWNNTREIIRRFGFTPLSRPGEDPPAGAPFVDGLFRIDYDKTLYVQLVSDDLSAYDPSRVYGTWRKPDLGALLENRQREIEMAIFGSQDGSPNQNLVLILLESPGRMVTLGLDESPEPFRSPRLLMTCSDLVSISEVEHGDPLLLWNFAQASDRIRNSTHIVQTSWFDEFAMYRSKDFSYYFSDDKRPDFITVTPGFGAKLRFQGKKERDYHAIPSLQPNHVVEVTNVYGDAAVPIQAVLSQAGVRSAYAVENLPVLIWVTSPEFDSDELRNLRSAYNLLTDAVAYWLWQFTPSISPLLQPIGERFQKLLIFVELEPSPEWLRETSAPEPPDENDIELRWDAGIPSLTIRFRPAYMRRLAGPDNAGERYLMQRVIDGLCALRADILGSSNGLPNREQIALMIDRHAPLGPKKKCIVVGSTTNPTLDDRDLPEFRHVSKAEINVLLDELGDYLIHEEGLAARPISDDNRVPLLNKVVGFYFSEFEKLVATLRPGEALPFVIARQEANAREYADRHLKIPTRLACFSTEPEMVEMLSKEIPEVNAANQCARFLIEYMAARPPSGVRPMSLTVYDRLIALADEIISWAYESDLIHFGIADLKMDILPSGRLGVERKVFQEAQKEFVSKMSLGEIIRAPGRLPQYWREAQPSRSGPPPDLERGFQVEFSYSLSEYGLILGEIYNIGVQQDGPVKFYGQDELVEELRSKTQLDEGKIWHVIEDLILSPRDSFLKPPDGFETHDVYPWRFTRPLSYLRRPLIRSVVPSGTFVTWGNRHLYESGRYLIGIILSGRLQPRTTELKQFIAKVNEEESAAFNERVADAFEEVEGVEVARNIKKIGGKRIQGANGDLGDIDVLVVNSKKREALVIECKDFEQARNPREYANELKTLFLGNKENLSTVAKHQRRIDWVKQNLSVVLNHFKIKMIGRWKVRALIVVSEEIFSPHIFPSTIPVISYEGLVRDFIPLFE